VDKRQSSQNVSQCRFKPFMMILEYRITSGEKLQMVNCWRNKCNFQLMWSLCFTKIAYRFFSRSMPKYLQLYCWNDNTSPRYQNLVPAFYFVNLSSRKVKLSIQCGCWCLTFLEDCIDLIYLMFLLGRRWIHWHVAASGQYCLVILKLKYSKHIFLRGKTCCITYV